MGYFKYVLERGGGFLYCPEDYNWLQRLWLRMQGYKVRKLIYDENGNIINA